jgi:hypothetical protein
MPPFPRHKSGNYCAGSADLAGAPTTILFGEPADIGGTYLMTADGWQTGRQLPIALGGTSSMSAE